MPGRTAGPSTNFPSTIQDVGDRDRPGHDEFGIATAPRACDHSIARRSWREASTPATVEPNSEGLGATVSPQERMISAFSAALSPAAEMIAPAWPMRRPFGAVSPATKPTTGFFMFSLIQAEASAS